MFFAGIELVFGVAVGLLLLRLLLFGVVVAWQLLGSAHRKLTEPKPPAKDKLPIWYQSK